MIGAFAATIYGIIRDRLEPDAFQKLLGVMRHMAHDHAKTMLRLIEVESLLAEYEAGHAANRRLMKQHQLTPAWSPSLTLNEISNGHSRLSRLLPLYDVLCDKFSDGELYDLSYRIGLAEIEGEDHDAKARFLIEYAVRHELLGDLLGVGRKIRPECDWPQI